MHTDYWRNRNIPIIFRPVASKQKGGVLRRGQPFIKSSRERLWLSSDTNYIRMKLLNSRSKMTSGRFFFAIRRVSADTLDSATTLKVANKEAASSSPKNRRAVRFAEEQNVYHNNRSEHKKAMHRLWYSGEEMRVMMAEVKSTAKTLHTRASYTSSPQYWSRLLSKVYEAFESAGDTKAVLSTLDTSQLKVPVKAIGLERWLIQAIQTERLLRRRLHVEQVQEAQTMSLKKDAATRAREIRKASREVSRSDRVFAAYLAITIYNNRT
jgi:hypothetical protein